jgi:serine/threonine protein kinase
VQVVKNTRRLSRFEILDVLGEGRYSTVYRAFDPLLERQVALKLPRPGTASATRALERFLGEARALAQIRHPRIVPIYEAGRDGDRYYIAMALIEGQGLAERMAEGPLPFHRIAEIIIELADALAHTHSLGIIHRDIKPANIRLDKRGTAYLMDFGIAYRPESGEVPTPPGMIMGTPAYVAPEQAKGGQTNILPASDQYSLGAVFYELLAGKPPFLGPPPSVLFHAIHHDPASPRSIQPRVPRTLDAICRKAMAKQPEQRYSSCQALADDLRRWLGGSTSRGRSASWAPLRF